MGPLELPVRFENPLVCIFAVTLGGGIFAFLLYLSHKRLGIAERRLEIVKWQTVRKVVSIINICMKIGVIVALSFLLAIPYFPMTVEVPIEELSGEQLAQNSATVMLLMDVSYSMNYSDLKPSRLQVAKNIAKLLVYNMSSVDLIGFISFAGRIYDEMLPTLNRSSIANVIDDQMLHSSTAIGTALETALGVLEPYEGGKAVVLLSDGKSNLGIMDLTSVAEAAAAMEIPVFTVFFGTYGIGEADPIALEEVSQTTGGGFFEVKSEEIEALITEVSMISREVKSGALKAAFVTLTLELRDYYTPMLFFAVLLVISLFSTWFTGV